MTTSRLLADDPRFTYRCSNGQRTVRRLRVWGASTGPVAVVTEGPTDVGMSVTNAAELVVAEVRRQYGGRFPGLIVVEHYPERGHAHARLAESFDQITVTGERASWTHIPAPLFLLSVGLDTYPT